MDRIAIKKLSREQIKGKIGILTLVIIIYIGISMIVSLIPFIGNIINAFFISPALSLSITIIFLNVTRAKTIAVGDIFEGFYDFWSAFKVTWLVGLFTFLWSLLFIIPGIIKTYSYSMAMFILAENKGMSALEAIKKSQTMMEGKKMDLFVLELSFLGWMLLGALTFGIAYIWVIPYYYTAYANFYNALKPTEVIDVPSENIQIEEVTDEE